MQEASQIVPEYQPSQRHGASGLRFVLTSAGLALLTLVVFGRSIQFDFILVDDRLHVTANPFVNTGINWPNIVWAFTSTGTPYWQPVTWLSLQLDASAFGTETAWGFHLVNVLWHVVNVILVLVVFERLTGEFWASALSAALFAVHPLRAESVAWVTERKDVLAMFFLLLTLWVYIGYAQRPSIWKYLLILALFVLGLASKPMAVTLPAGLLLLDFWPLQRVTLGRWLSWRRGVRGTMPVWMVMLEKLPMVVFSLVSANFVMVGVRDETVDTMTIDWNQRLAMVLSGYLTYLEKTFWPVDLTFFPSVPDHFPLSRLALAFSVLAIITAVLVKWRPQLVVGWFWFLGTLVPVMGFVQSGQMAPAPDRFTYMPHLGLFLVVVLGLKALADEWHVPLAWRFAAGLLCVLGLTVMGYRQVGYWQDDRTLFTHTLDIDPNSPTANAGLALHYREARDMEKAAFYFQRLKTVEQGRKP